MIKLGVVAVVPFWSQADNLNADSNYVFLRTVLPEMERQTENTLFLVFFPDPKVGRGSWKFQPDGLQSDRVRFVSWPYDTAMLTGVLSFDMQRWYEIENNYAPAQYWLHQVESGSVMFGGYTRSFSHINRPSIVAQHHYIIHKSLPYPIYSAFPRLWAQMGGSVAADRVVYNSQHTLDMARESFGDWLNATKMQELEEKSVVLKFGLMEENEPVAPPADEDSVPVFLYNHRFEAYKQPQITFGILNEMRDRGQKFEVWVTQAAGQRSGGRKGLNFDKVVYAPKRADYLRNISVPAINMINSMHETYCIAMADSIARGHLCIAPNAVTFPELVPADYPFLFNNENEQRAIVDRILSTWPLEYNNWRERLIAHALENNSVKLYAAKYLQLMQEAEQRYLDTDTKSHTKEGLLKMFDAMGKGQHYTPRDLMKLAKSVFAAKGRTMGTQALGPRRMVRESLRLRDDIAITWDRGVRLTRI
jgi:glycosyltransferase involved in cell wall biosynthesis